ncbi:transposase [Planctomycetes bacterium K23_9]|uniref:transposase n=1 Tax=Stieleria marina TaxID=1930275 RepID=UPI0011A19D96
MARHCEENDQAHTSWRSHGGYSTKLHVMTDARGTLLPITAAGGQRNESQECDNSFEHNQASVHFLRDQSAAIAGDKGYRSAAIRESIEHRSIEAVTPTRSNATVSEEFARAC